MGKKRLDYDDERLVELIVEGQMTYADIGRELGISRGLVKKVAMGTRRPELLRCMWDTEEGILAEARRVGSRFARNIMMETVRVALKGEGEQARRAREFVLKFVTTSRPKRADLPGDPPLPRPQEVQDLDRALGIVPWEEEEAARLEAEAAEEEARLAAEAAEAAALAARAAAASPASSMAAEGLLPAGENRPIPGGA